LRLRSATHAVLTRAAENSPVSWNVGVLAAEAGVASREIAVDQQISGGLRSGASGHGPKCGDADKECAEGAT